MSVRDLAPDVLSKIMGLIINLRNLNCKLERNVLKDSSIVMPRPSIRRAKIASFLTYWLDVASVLLGIEITNKCLKMIITFIFGKIKYITKNKYLKFKTFLNVEHCLCINLKEF